MGTSADSWRRSYSDGQLGCQQEQEGQEGSPGGKTKPPGRQERDTLEKLLLRSERPNGQHLVEKILTMKVFTIKDSYELK